MNGTILVSTEALNEQGAKRLDGQEDVALIDAAGVCAMVAMSKSWLYAQVAAGEFPAPVIREPRCSRWRLADVRAHLMAVFEKAKSSSDAAVATILKAKGASDAARAKLLARPSGR